MLLLFFILPIIKTLCQSTSSPIKIWPNTTSEIYNLNNYDKILSFSSSKTTTIKIFMAIKDNTNYIQFYDDITSNYSAPANLSSVDYFFKDSTKYYASSFTSPYLYILTSSSATTISSDVMNATGIIAGYSYIREYIGLMIVFLNTNSIKLFNVKEENYYGICHNSQQDIIQTATFSYYLINDDKEHRFIALTFGERGNNVYYLIVIEQDGGGSCNTISKKDYTMSIYSSILISNIPSDKTAIVFSYDKNTTIFSYYHIKWKDQKINWNGNIGTLKSLSNLTLTNAIFINNTEYLAYVAENSNNDEFIGVVDLLYNIMIYNYKNPYGGKINYLTYLNETKDSNPNNYVSFSVNNVQFKLCPFVYDSNTCTMETKSGYYMKISEKAGNSFIPSKDCSLVLGNRYCIDECPIGYKHIGTSCEKCKNIYLFVNQTCSNECPSPSYIEPNGICYNCRDINSIYYKYNCIDNCSNVYAEYIESSNSCINCKEKGQYYYNNKCVNKCPAGSYLINSTGECYKCKDYNTFYFEGKCYDSCNETQVYDDDYICYSCIDKDKEKIYKENNKCVKNCSDGYGKEEDKKMCISCKETNGTKCENEKCVDNCTAYFILENKTYQCYNCSEKYPYSAPFYFENNTCMKQCPFQYGENALNNTKFCENCSTLEINKLYSEKTKTCVEKCQNDTIETSETEITNDEQATKYCKYCKVHNNFYFKNKCYTDCPNDTISNISDFTCKACYDDNKYVEKNQCVNECSEYSIIIQDSKICYDCSSTKRYKYHNECLLDCPIGTQKKEYLCENCKFQEQYYYQGECLPNCTENSYGNEDGFCLNCYCFDRGICSTSSNKCICNSDIYYGHSCEIENVKFDSKLKIIPIYNGGSVLQTYENCFTYTLNDSKPYKYKLNWNFSNSKINNNNGSYYFITGKNDDIFCLIENALEIGNSTNILSLILMNLDENKNYSSEIKISTFINTTENFFGGCEPHCSSFSLIKASYKQSIPIEMNMTFQYYMKDEYQEIIPLTPLVKSSTIEHLITFTNKSIYGKSIDDRGEFKSEELSLFPFNTTEMTNNITEILSNSTLGKVTKIFYLYYYFFKNKQSDNSIKATKTEMSNLLNFIIERANEIGDKGYYIDNNIVNTTTEFNYTEPRTIFSLMNKLILDSDKYTYDEYVQLSKTLKDVIGNMKGIGKYREFKAQVISIFRTIDNLLTSFKNSDISNEDKDNIFIKNIKYTIEQLAFEISLKMENNGDVGLMGKNIQLNISRFGREQTTLTLYNSSYIEDKNSNISNYKINWYSLTSKSLYQNENSIPKGVYLFIAENEFRKIKNEIKLKDGTNITNISLCIIQFYKNKKKNHSYPYKTSINLHNTEKNKLYNNINSLLYEIAFPLIKEDTINLRVLVKNISNAKSTYFNAANFTCIPSEDSIENLIINPSICYTHFNYEENLVICKCNSSELVSYINNYTIAEYYKKIQFPQVHYSNINLLSSILILTSFSLILIPGIFLMIFDIYNDNNYINNYTIKTEVETQIEIFQQYKKLKNNSYISFAWNITLIHFPFFSIFINYSYNNPMFIKYCINLLGLLWALLLSSLPFYFITPFQKKIDFINMRDIKNDDAIVHNIPVNVKDVSFGFIVTLLSTIIVKIIISFIDSKMIYTQIEKENLKIKKVQLSEYVNNIIKKNVNLPENWKPVKEKIFAINLICGKYYSNILNRKRKDKYTNYLKYKKLVEEESLVNEPLLPHENLNNSISSEGDENVNDLEIYSKKRGSKKYNNNEGLIGSLNFKDEKFPPLSDEGFNLDEYYNKINKSIDDDLHRKITMNKIKNKGNIIERINKKNRVINIVSFTINNENKSILGFKEIQEFEGIRNAYIYPIVDEEDNEKENDIWKTDYNNIHSLQIAYRENVTYLSDQNSTSPFAVTKSEIMQIRIISIVLLIILAILYFVIIIISRELFEKYEFFIIKCWLIPAFIELTIGNFFFVFLGNIIVSLILFKCFHLKKINNVVRVFYILFIRKFVIYLFQIRNYITKYYSDFEYLEKHENNNDLSYD